MTTYLLLFDSYGLVLWGALSGGRMGLSFVYVASYDTQGHSGGIRTRLHTDWVCLTQSSVFIARFKPSVGLSQFFFISEK
jgi:hypothetical protein